jgi:hypothetical protein
LLAEALKSFTAGLDMLDVRQARKVLGDLG